MGARILIVDDHEVLRKGVRSLIEESGRGWEICGEASTGTEAIEAVKTAKPDIVVLDIALPEMSGIEAASRIAKLGSRCGVLLFTMYESKRLETEAREAGAQGFVLKSQAAHHLILAIERVLAGGTFFGSPEGNSAPGKDTSPQGGPFLRLALDLFCS